MANIYHKDLTNEELHDPKAGSSPSFVDVTLTGQLTSTLAIGTAPFVVTSTTEVANLKAATAGNADTVTTITGLAPDTQNTYARTQYLIPYAGTTTSMSEIAIGTDGQVLTSAGAGVAPSFEAVTTLNNSSIVETTGDYNAVWVDSSDNVWAAFSDGLYKSTDKGATWTLKDEISNSGLVAGMVFQATNGYLYWSPWEYGSLRRSTNSGEAWGDVCSFAASANRDVWGFDEDVSGGAYDGYLYASIYAGDGTDDDHIYRSTDNGANWTSVYSSTNHHVHNVKVDPYTGYVYACTGDGAGEDNIIRSIDSGTNWTVLDSDKRCIAINFFSGVRVFGEDETGKVYLTTNDSDFTTVYDDSDGGGDMGWWASYKYDGKVYMIGLNLSATDVPKIISSDDGTNWEVSVRGDDRAQYEGYSFISNADSNGNIYVSTEGDTDKNFRFSPDTLIYANKIIAKVNPLILGSSEENIFIDFSTNSNRATIGSYSGITNIHSQSGIDWNFNGDVAVSGTFTVNGDEIICDGNLTLNPASNNVILDNAHLQIQDTYSIKHTGTSNQWLELFNNDTDTGWYWSTTYDVLEYYDNNVSIFGLDTGNVYSKKALMIGSYSADSNIWTSTNGTGSTTMYIGNETIDTGGASDARVKTNVAETKFELDDLLKLKVVDFNYTKDYAEDITTVHTGLIAQDVEKIYPYAVETLENIKFDEFKMIDYKKLVPLLIKSMQELETRVKELEN